MQVRNYNYRNTFGLNTSAFPCYFAPCRTGFTYDKANQLATKTENGKTINYTYDAAGRLIKEGNRTYKYGFMNKVMEVHEDGKLIAKMEYHGDGQLAEVRRADGVELFDWDGLALINRSYQPTIESSTSAYSNTYINEPAITGGNPILSNDTVMFNDMLGSTYATSSNGNITSIERTQFGVTDTKTEEFFTGKPHIKDMDYAFLFRNYRSELSKWQSADPIGYPDGLNNFAYVNNWVIGAIDYLGAKVYWAARDLASSPVGNHHYLVFIPDNPADFKSLETFADGSKGYTIAAIKEDGFLNYKKNYTTDIAAINEYFGGTDAGWDPEFNVIPTPQNMSDTEFINQLQKIADSYKNDSVNYDLNDENCAAWVNTLLDTAGIPESERDKYGEFFGVDWGEEDLLPNGSFTYE